MASPITSRFHVGRKSFVEEGTLYTVLDSLNGDKPCTEYGFPNLSDAESFANDMNHGIEYPEGW